MKKIILLVPNYEREIYLKVKVEKGGICSFSYSLDGKKYKSVGIFFTARQGKWIGAKVGLFSISPYGKERGWVDADCFRISEYLLTKAHWLFGKCFIMCIFAANETIQKK